MEWWRFDFVLVLVLVLVRVRARTGQPQSVNRPLFVFICYIM